MPATTAHGFVCPGCNAPVFLDGPSSLARVVVGKDGRLSIHFKSLGGKSCPWSRRLATDAGIITEA